LEWIEAEPAGPRLARGEVHVWRFRLADPAHGVVETTLTDAELARAREMSAPMAAASFVTSQVAVRQVLSAHMQVPPKSIEIVRGAHGKPMLDDAARPLEFNVSHSGDWGLLAVARMDVGVDVEQVRPQRVHPRFEQRFLTPAERELLRARRATDGDAAFFVVWSRKEAYLKATGFGLAAPFSRLNSAGDSLPDLDAQGNQQAGNNPWSIMDFFVDERHVGAVVARVPELSVKFFTLRAKP
jgi:4'-phosphopantetheinyl transferase